MVISLLRLILPYVNCVCYVFVINKPFNKSPFPKDEKNPASSERKK